MRIRRPRGVTTAQFMVVTAVGVLAGVYIWQPLVFRFRKESGNKEAPAAATSPAK